MLPATITSINQAFREIKSFNFEEWEGDYRPASRQAIKQVLEGHMRNHIDLFLQDLQSQGTDDRKNGSFSRHLLTEIGDVELRVPRTRTFSAVGLVRKFARRTQNVDRLILRSFVFGLSTRKVGQALLAALGEPVSPQTVSRIAAQLDAAVQAYQHRKLSDPYEILILDGIVLKRKTGIGTQKRTVLVALGIHPDGKREIIDFRQVRSESNHSWEGFLNHLFRRGLEGRNLKLIIIDGGKGLQAALPLVYGLIPIQRCWAHKTRNVLNYVKKRDWKKVKNSLHRISYARNLPKAQKAAQRFVQRWGRHYPNAVKCLQANLPELLAFLRISTQLPAKALRTTNAIERRFREVRRRTRPMGVFSNNTSMDRILFSVFTHENQKEGINAPFLLTQNS